MNPDPHITGTHNPRAGLTLIEVMLAMAILALGLVVMIESVSRCLAVVRAARLYNQAHALLAQVEHSNPLFNEELQAGIERGRFDGDYRNFEWERHIDPVGDEEDRLFLVRTRVLWSRRGQTSFEEVAEYRYSPLEDEFATTPTRRSPQTTPRDRSAPR